MIYPVISPVISFAGRSQATIERREQARKELITAEKMLRFVQEKYGKPKSSSWLQLKRMQNKDNPKFADLSGRLASKADGYDFAITYRPYEHVNNNVSGEKPAKDLVGNCDHCAKTVQLEYLFEHKKPTANIVVNVEKADGKGFCNHVFNVSNLEKGADLKDPKTWGKGAIVTDLWAGIAKPADAALSYYNQLFDIDPAKDKVTFDAFEPEENVQKMCLKELGMYEEKPRYDYQFYNYSQG